MFRAKMNKLNLKLIECEIDEKLLAEKTNIPYEKIIDEKQQNMTRIEALRIANFFRCKVVDIIDNPKKLKKNNIRLDIDIYRIITNYANSKQLKINSKTNEIILKSKNKMIFITKIQFMQIQNIAIYISTFFFSLKNDKKYNIPAFFQYYPQYINCIICANDLFNYSSGALICNQSIKIINMIKKLIETNERYNNSEYFMLINIIPRIIYLIVNEVNNDKKMNPLLLYDLILNEFIQIEQENFGKENNLLDL